MLEEITERVKQELGVADLPSLRDKEINERLRAKGSRERLCSGFYGDKRNLIFGEAREGEIEGYPVIVFEREEAQTPNNNPAIVAVTGDGQIFIREEIFHVIFLKKWIKLFDLSENEKKKIFYNPGRNFGFGIKQKVLDLYEITDKKKLLSAEKVFIKDMMTNVVCHEFGHNLVELEHDLSALGEAAKVFGENILSILKETLADWYPYQKQGKGTIRNIVDTALREKDPKRALRLFYLYLSDCWFLDTPNTPLYPYAYLTAALLIKYVEEDKDVDFQGLDREIESIYRQLLEQYIDLVKGLREIGEKAVFNVKGTTLDFAQISIYLKSDFQKKDGFVDENSGQYKDAFWVNVMKYIVAFSSDASLEVKAYLKQGEDKLLKGLKDQIMRQMKELGFWHEVAPLGERDVVNLVMEELDLNNNEKEIALAEFDRLSIGDFLRLGISYEGKPRPFFRVLQELLKKTKLGRIEDGMAVRGLDCLVDYFKRGAFLKVKLLRVNSRVMSQETAQKMIKDNNLDDKIEKIECDGVNSCNDYEVYTPIVDGYPDWSTAQAIWRINQDFRPDDKEREWVLDQKVFSLLAQRFLEVI